MREEELPPPTHYKQTGEEPSPQFPELSNASMMVLRGKENNVDGSPAAVTTASVISPQSPELVSKAKAVTSSGKVVSGYHLRDSPSPSKPQLSEATLRMLRSQGNETFL